MGGKRLGKLWDDQGVVVQKERQEREKKVSGGPLWLQKEKRLVRGGGHAESRGRN